MHICLRLFCQRLMPFLTRLPNTLCAILITGLRPLLGPAVCKYELSCTHYALLQLEIQPWHKAVWLIFKRVLSCNFFT